MVRDCLVNGAVHVPFTVHDCIIFSPASRRWWRARCSGAFLETFSTTGQCKMTVAWHGKFLCPCFKSIKSNRSMLKYLLCSVIVIHTLIKSWCCINLRKKLFSLLLLSYCLSLGLRNCRCLFISLNLQLVSCAKINWSIFSKWHANILLTTALIALIRNNACSLLCVFSRIRGPP